MLCNFEQTGRRMELWTYCPVLFFRKKALFAGMPFLGGDSITLGGFVWLLE
jgi:hypothetical protein